MNQGSIQILFALLRSAICGTKLTKSEREVYSEDMLRDLPEISAKHDVTHLLALGLKRNGLISDDAQGTEKYILKAAFRCEQINYELDKICDVLEKAHIPFLPLKGSVIRKYYPEPWMRTSCDIDVLVHPEDLQKAISILEKELEYRFECKNSHDASMFTKKGLHIELHYDLVEDDCANDASKVLKNVWFEASKHNGYDYWYEMPDEMFYFYHIAHMAKHFVNGGCGIRPFIDIWVLSHNVEFDREERDKLLSDGNLITFAKCAELLSDIWFGNACHNETTLQMEEYILHGGVYGTSDNLTMVQQQKRGGKMNYAISKIFLPYDKIKYHYPILEKHRWLTPFMEVRRWGKLIFCGHLKRTTGELKYNSSISEDAANRTKTMLKNIGL